MPPKSHYPQSDEGNAVSPRALEVNSSQLPGSSHPRAPALAALTEAGKSQPWWTNTCRKKDRNQTNIGKDGGIDIPFVLALTCENQIKCIYIALLTSAEISKCPHLPRLSYSTMTSQRHAYIENRSV
jgi:hypothetical protein